MLLLHNTVMMSTRQLDGISNGNALKKNRKLTVDMVKRELIRSAAKKLFAESG